MKGDTIWNIKKNRGNYKSHIKKRRN